MKESSIFLVNEVSGGFNISNGAPGQTPVLGGGNGKGGGVEVWHQHQINNHVSVGGFANASGPFNQSYGKPNFGGGAFVGFRF